MDVDKSMIASGADWLYSAEFKTLIESHLNFIRTHPSTKVITVTLENTRIFRHDFYGLLTSIQIQPKDFWVILRLNNMHNPQEFDETKNILYVPENRLLEQIKMAYRSISAITK
jgi:thiosulfate reductase cytochrome b subunit